MRHPILMAAILLAICGWAPPGTAAEQPDRLTPLQIKQVLLLNDSPAVLLLDESEERYLLIFIDFFMANAIRMGMEGPNLKRPLTHDLIGILLRRLGAKLTKITITELKDNTYYALISVQVNGELAEFDARPSDALALAVRSRAPIFAAEALLKKLTGQPGQEGRPPPLPAPEAVPPKGKA